MFKLLKLALHRFRSSADYREMQRYLAEKSVAELQAKGVDFAQSRVLELGSGRGGYSLVLNQVSREFVASDLEEVSWAAELGVPFTKVDALKPFPFESGNFDLVYCSSVIEHVANPGNLLRESWRVLKPGGLLYLSFPPFYSLAMVGGHQFKPFHLLGERWAIRLTNLVHRSHYEDYASAFGTFGLYPLTIDQVKSMALAHQFQVLSTFTRASPINTSRLPGLLKDALTWHVCYLCRKPWES